MFALGEFDKWYSAMIVSAGGSTQGLQCEFGISSLPDDLNRINFMMCDVIQARSAGLMDDLIKNPSPWSFNIVDMCVLFSAMRELVGGHTRGFDQFPWFDDNVAASLRPITTRLRKIRLDTWAEFHWDVSLPRTRRLGCCGGVWAFLAVKMRIEGFLTMTNGCYPVLHPETANREPMSQIQRNVPYTCHAGGHASTI